MLTLFVGGPRHGEVLSVEAGTNHVWVEISVAGKPVRQTYTPARIEIVSTKSPSDKHLQVAFFTPLLVIGRHQLLCDLLEPWSYFS